MKLGLILVISLFMISCSNNSSQRSATNSLCDQSNLLLSTYKPSQAKTVSLPSNPNKSDDDIIAKDGTYILSGSTIHIHDLGQPVPDAYENDGPEFLQFAIAFTLTPQNDADKKENTLSFNGSLSCLSGLMPEHAGKLSYLSNIPTTIEVDNFGTSFVPKSINTVKFGYAQDRAINITPSPLKDKSSIDQIEKINTSDKDTITNIYQTSPTSEVYQLQSRVTQGDIVLTVINSYTRCIDPSEIPKTADAKKKQIERTQKENDKLQKEYDLCLSRKIKLN